MVFTYKKINEEAEIEKVETEVAADAETKQAAIDLLKDLLSQLEEPEEAADEEEEEDVEVDVETCKESAQMLVESMKAVMESDADTEVKLEATAMLNSALHKIMIEADIDESDGGLPEEAAENEAEQEICPETGERVVTDVDVDAANDETEVKESAAVALLRQMLKK